MSSPSNSPHTDVRRIRTVREGLLSWYEENARDYFPWRMPGTSPFHVLVFEVLSHQTFARKIVPVYESLVKKYPAPADMARADAEEIRDEIRSLGLLYRADRLKAMAACVVEDFDGEVPDDEGSLLTLPGVGVYTANAVRAFGFGQQVHIVDTNVLRVYRRVFSTGEHTTARGPDKPTEEVARAALPPGKARDYNYAVLDFAALQCTHYSPGCPECPLLDLCDFGAAQSP